MVWKQCVLPRGRQAAPGRRQRCGHLIGPHLGHGGSDAFAHAILGLPRSYILKHTRPRSRWATTQHRTLRAPLLRLCRATQAHVFRFCKLSEPPTKRIVSSGTSRGREGPPLCSQQRCPARAGPRAGTVRPCGRWSAPPACTAPACQCRRRRGGGRVPPGCRSSAAAATLAAQLRRHSAWEQQPCAC